MGKGKQIILICAGGFLLLLVLLFLFLQRKGKGTTVGYHGISGEYAEAIQRLAERDEANGEVEWIELTEEDVLSRGLSKKADLLISYNGFLTDNLSKKALPLPEGLSYRFPRSIRTSPWFSRALSEGSREFTVMPLLLNHYETAYFEVLQERSGLPWPGTLDEMERYARACREWVGTPMVCAGGDDGGLFLMISLLAESLGGAEGYTRLAEDLRSAGEFEEVLELPLGGRAPGGTRFASLLDILKGWQKEGLLLPGWYDADDRLITVFMEDNHAALVFMSLEEHRRKPYQTIKYFQAHPFPAAYGIKETTVEPALSVLCFRETERTGALLDLFSSAPGQEALSASTGLSPAGLRGAAVDIQADDGRFFAAASSGGPVPDLGRAAFLRESDRAALARKIREYLARP